jgi:two-component system, cell cycle response regulator DivK
MPLRKTPLILVADDYADSRELYAEYLAHRGLAVIEASSGDEVLAHAFEHLPDAIVMDLCLLGLDGLEATRRLKADARTQAIPVLVMTGRTLPEDAARAEAAGCDAFLTKPCLPRHLFEQVSNVLSASGKR